MDAGTLELVELDTRLDWDHVPMCDVKRSGCDRAADVVEVNQCCGASCYSCAPHQAELDAYVLSLDSYTCSRCGARMPPFEWKPIR